MYHDAYVVGEVLRMEAGRAKWRQRQKRSRDAQPDDPATVTRDTHDTHAHAVAFAVAVEPTTLPLVEGESEGKTRRKPRAVLEGGTGKPPKRATRLPEDWRNSDECKRCITWAQQCYKLTDREAAIMAATFQDYWTAKSGANATKLDWFATWRNWVRREREK